MKTKKKPPVPSTPPKLDPSERLSSLILLCSEVMFLADAVDQEVMNGRHGADGIDEAQQRRVGMLVAGTMTLRNKVEELHREMQRLESDVKAVCG